MILLLIGVGVFLLLELYFYRKGWFEYKEREQASCYCGDPSCKMERE